MEYGTYLHSLSFYVTVCTRLCNEVKKFAIELDKTEYQRIRFEPPVKILKSTINRITGQLNKVNKNNRLS